MRSKLAAIGGLFKAAAVNWVDDYAQSMGAARNSPGRAAVASYTMFCTPSMGKADSTSRRC